MPRPPARHPCTCGRSPRSRSARANDGALPLTPDPTIGRGPAAQKAVKLPKVATEIPSLRDEHSRTLLNPDGTYTLEATEGRMNYQAPDGTWQPEDLSLTTDAAGAFDLRVKASDRVVRFGSTDADAGLASISADGHAISIRAIGYRRGRHARRGRQPGRVRRLGCQRPGVRGADRHGLRVRRHDRPE